MVNNSGFKPLGSAVLVEPYEPETRVGRIILPPNARERLQSAEQRATVIAVGPEAWIRESAPRAKPGDKVMISAYAGCMCLGPLDGKTYRCVNANDLFLCIEHEKVWDEIDGPATMSHDAETV